MTEQNWQNRFGEDVDQYLEDGTVPADATPEYQAMLRITQELRVVDFSHQSQHHNKRRYQNMTNTNHWYTAGLMTFVLGTAAAVILIAAVAAITLGNPFDDGDDNLGAQPISSPTPVPTLPVATATWTATPIPTTVATVTPIPPPQAGIALPLPVTLGNVTLVNDTTDAQNIVDENQAGVDMDVMAVPTPNYAGGVSVQPVDALEPILRGRLLVPGQIPDGYRMTLRFRNTPPSDTVGGITTTYNNPDFSGAIIIDQLNFVADDPRELELNVEEVGQTTIRGQAGIYAEGVALGWINNRLSYDPVTGQVVQNPEAQPPNSVWDFRMIMWEEDGTVFRVMSNTVDFMTLVQIAESMQPAPAP